MTAPYRLRDAFNDRAARLKLVAMLGAAVLVGTSPTVLIDSSGAVGVAYVVACVGLLLTTMYGADRRLREVSA
jgi:hypothetical protein